MADQAARGGAAPILLKDKIAVIHGAGGSLGGAVARAFAHHGAHVVLCGRSRTPLDSALNSVLASGGAGEVVVVDALNGDEVDAAVSEVRRRHGRFDVSFNLIGLDDLQGTALLDMRTNDVLRPTERALRSHLLTASAAARAMAEGGVILALTANCGHRPVAGVGGFGVACAAVEALLRQFAAELGPRGIRTACLLSAGSPDSAGVREVFELHAAAAGIDRFEFERRAGAGTMLGHLPRLCEVADAAVIFASDHARAMTGVVANVTCGEITD